MLSRRGFITGVAALLTAPAIVRASSLDYVPRALVQAERIGHVGVVSADGYERWIVYYRGGHKGMVFKWEEAPSSSPYIVEARLAG